MKQIELELIAKTDKALDEIKNVAAAIEGSTNEMESFKNATKKSLDDVSKSTKKGTSAIKGLSKGFKGLGLAAKGFVFALGGKILEQFFAVLNQNQVIVDSMATAFGTVASITNKLVGIVVDAGKEFTSLGDILKNTVMIPINLLKTSFFTIQSGILQAQLAWEGSFFGGNDADKIEQLKGDIQEVNDKLYDSATGVVDNLKGVGQGFVEAGSQIGGFVEEVSEGINKIDVLQTAANQKRLQQLRNETRLALAENDKLQFQFQLAAERQRQIRDDVTASIEDRTKANNQLGEVLKEQFDLQIANANKALELAELELQGNPKSIDAKEKLIEAEKNLFDVKENIAGFESEQRVNAEALELEAIDLLNTRLEAENARAIAKKRFNAEEIEDDILRLEKLKEVLAEETAIEDERLQGEIDRLAVGTQARQDAEQALFDFRQQKELEGAELDNQISKQKEDNDKKDLATKKMVENQKKQIVSDALGFVANILGENSKAGKAAAIAQATINSLLGFTEVLKTPTTIPEPFGSIQKVVSAGSILASGFATVKKIAATKAPGAEGGTSVDVAGPRGAAAPAFNVVGASPENQLAQTIGEQSKQPTRAYVVSDDVTNAQALDRKIVQGASIG